MLTLKVDVHSERLFGKQSTFCLCHSLQRSYLIPGRKGDNHCSAQSKIPLQSNELKVINQENANRNLIHGSKAGQKNTNIGIKLSK